MARNLPWPRRDRPCWGAGTLGRRAPGRDRPDTTPDEPIEAVGPRSAPVRVRGRRWRIAVAAAAAVLVAGAVDLVGFRGSPQTTDVRADPTTAAPTATRGSTTGPTGPAPGQTGPAPRNSGSATARITPGGSSPAGNPASPPPGGYPNAGNTGVPAGTRLTVVNGDFKTSRAGQVVTGLDITGTLIVNHDNVTVRNSRIRDRVDYRSTSGTSLTIEDSEIGPDGCPGSIGAGNPNDYPLVYYSGWYTLRRVHLHGDEDLLRTSYGTTLVQDSYLDHTCMYAGAHADAVQQYSPGDVSRVTLIHNTIDGRPANTASDKGNSAVFWSDHPGAGSSLTAYNNLFAGGNYSVWTTDAPAGSGIVIDIHNNQFVRGSFAYGPHNCANSIPFNGREGVKWTNNTYSDNRQQIPTDC